MDGLTVKDIWVSFPNKPHVLSGVSFEQARGEVLAVLGPSGCGKSTLLAVIAGLIQQERGTVRWQGKDLSETPAHKRGFGLMFQDYALFPHMRVRDNVAFGLRMQGLPRPAMDKRVTETLDLVGLPGYEERDVHNLSGGEQQRVALARALAPKPNLLMLDEPMGSLDRALRERLLEDLRSIVRQSGQTTLYVTHDQEEAYTLADRIVVMQAGQVAQIGTPQEIYRQPASPFVARFIGLTNFVPGEAAEGQVATPLGTFPLPNPAAGPVEVLFRPDAVRLGQGDYTLQGTVAEVIFQGDITRINVKVGENELYFEVPSTSELPAVDDRVSLSFVPAEGLQIFEPEKGNDFSNE